MALIHYGFITVIKLICVIFAKDRRMVLKNEEHEIVCNSTEHMYSRNESALECNKCLICPEGFRIKQICTLQSDTICEKCGDGYYAPKGSKHCKKCRQCQSNEHPQRSCNAGRNTRCKSCKEGRYYTNDKNKCLKCRVCPPGWYVKEACTVTSNTVCRRCPPGTFSDRFGLNTRCTPCRACHNHEEILKPCTRENNNICGKCRQGYFRIIASGNCGMCSACYKDYPGYTFEIPECIHRGNGSSDVCMPVIYPPIRYNTIDYTVRTTDHTDKQEVLSDLSSILNNDVISSQLIYFIGGCGGIAFFVIITVSGLCIVHRRKMKRIQKSNSLLDFKRNSEYTENWVFQNEFTFKVRSHSAPFIVFDNNYQKDERQRPHSVSNHVDIFETFKFRSWNLNQAKF